MTFEEAELGTLRHGQALSAEDKLRWLEQAEDLALAVQRTRQRQGLSIDPRYRDLVQPMVAEQQAPYPDPNRGGRTSDGH